MQAIVTKYLPATNFKGSRIKASAQAGSIILSWHSELNHDGNHTFAAKALAEKLGWHGRWVGGGLPDGKGDCYVCDDPHFSQVFTIERRVQS